MQINKSHTESLWEFYDQPVPKLPKLPNTWAGTREKEPENEYFLYTTQHWEAIMEASKTSPLTINFDKTTNSTTSQESEDECSQVETSVEIISPKRSFLPVRDEFYNAPIPQPKRPWTMKWVPLRSQTGLGQDTSKDKSVNPRTEDVTVNKDAATETQGHSPVKSWETNTTMGTTKKENESFERNLYYLHNKSRKSQETVSTKGHFPALCPSELNIPTSSAPQSKPQDEAQTQSMIPRTEDMTLNKTLTKSLKKEASTPTKIAETKAKISENTSGTDKKILVKPPMCTHPSRRVSTYNKGHYLGLVKTPKTDQPLTQVKVPRAKILVKPPEKEEKIQTKNLSITKTSERSYIKPDNDSIYDFSESTFAELYTEAPSDSMYDFTENTFAELYTPDQPLTQIKVPRVNDTAESPKKVKTGAWSQRSLDRVQSSSPGYSPHIQTKTPVQIKTPVRSYNNSPSDSMYDFTENTFAELYTPDQPLTQIKVPQAKILVKPPEKEEKIQTKNLSITKTSERSYIKPDNDSIYDFSESTFAELYTKTPTDSGFDLTESTTSELEIPQMLKEFTKDSLHPVKSMLCSVNKKPHPEPCPEENLEDKKSPENPDQGLERVQREEADSAPPSKITSEDQDQEKPTKTTDHTIRGPLSISVKPRMCHVKPNPVTSNRSQTPVIEHREPLNLTDIAVATREILEQVVRNLEAFMEGQESEVQMEPNNGTHHAASSILSIIVDVSYTKKARLKAAAHKIKALLVMCHAKTMLHTALTQLCSQCTATGATVSVEQLMKIASPLLQELVSDDTEPDLYERLSQDLSAGHYQELSKRLTDAITDNMAPPKGHRTRCRRLTRAQIDSLMENISTWLGFQQQQELYETVKTCMRQIRKLVSKFPATKTQSEEDQGTNTECRQGPCITPQPKMLDQRSDNSVKTFSKTPGSERSKSQAQEDQKSYPEKPDKGLESPQRAETSRALSSQHIQWDNEHWVELMRKVSSYVLCSKNPGEVEELGKELLQLLYSDLSEWDIKVKPDKDSIRAIACAVHKDLCKNSNKKWVRRVAKFDPSYKSDILECIKTHMQRPLQKKRTLGSVLRSVCRALCCWC